MQFLITGARGFVGRAVCRALRDQGRRVRTVSSSEVVAQEGLECVQLGHDAVSPAAWRAACEGVEVVIHLGARAHVLNEPEGDLEAIYQRANTDTTLALAQAALAAGVKRLVFVSSIGVLGSASGPEPFTEESEPRPHSPYARSKHLAEQGLRDLLQGSALELTIIRPPLVYGPGAPGNFGALVRAVARGWPLPLGAVHNRRSLVSLGNLVDFIVLCGAHPEAAQQTFLVSDGQDLSTTELLRGMGHAAGVRSWLVPVPIWCLRAAAALLGRGGALQRLCGNLQVDSGKARKLLGWVPPLTVAEGLKQAMTRPESS
jgi:nucleoside-diphosphate-sugar epimerase